jgi:hypothetical protein
MTADHPADIGIWVLKILNNNTNHYTASCGHCSSICRKLCILIVTEYFLLIKTTMMIIIIIIIICNTAF